MSKKLVICAVLLLAGSITLASCRSASGSPSPLITTTQATSGVPIDAAALFAANCAGCHGANRQGGVGPPLNAASLASRSETQVKETLANGRPGTAMPAWKDRLSPAQMEALAKFVKS